MVHRNVEEPLNLLGMKIHRNNPVRAGHSQQIRDELGGDRNPRLILAVLPGITEKGEHSGDPGGARPPGGVNHDQQLHEVVIRRFAGGLNQKCIGPPDVLFELHENLAVREVRQVHLAQADAEIVRNLL